MTSNERWRELKQRVEQYEAAVHLGTVTNHRCNQREHYGFNSALEWVEEQMEELEKQ